MQLVFSTATVQMSGTLYRSVTRTRQWRLVLLETSFSKTPRRVRRFVMGRSSVPEVAGFTAWPEHLNHNDNNKKGRKLSPNSHTAPLIHSGVLLPQPCLACLDQWLVDANANCAIVRKLQMAYIFPCNRDESAY